MKRDQFLLDRAYLTKNIEARIAKGTFFNIFTRLSNMVIQFGSVTILARILEPADFGLIAMVGVAIELLMNFKDLGLSYAVIQREQITCEQMNALFWLNVIAATLLTTLIAAASPIVSKVYHEPRLTHITVCLSTVFVLEGLSAQHRALIERHMLFKTLALIQIASQFGSKVLAISLAYLGYGYWALLFMMLSVPAIRTVLLWSLIKWRPGCPKRAKGVWEFFRFGIGISFTRLLEFVTEQLDNFLIGRYLGSHALGIYSRSYNLISYPEKLILWPFTQSMNPALSSIQKDHEKIREKTLWAIERVTFLLHPMCLWIFLCSKEIVLIILGHKWEEAIEVCMILSLWAFVRSTTTGSWWVLIIQARVARFTKWRLIETIFICIGIIVGLNWGVRGVAYGLTITTTLLKIPEIFYCYAGTPLKIKDFFYSIRMSFISSTLSLLAIYLISHMINKLGIVPALLTKTMIFGITYLFIFSLCSQKTMKKIIVEFLTFSYK